MGRVIQSLTKASSNFLDLPEVTDIGIGNFTMYATIRKKFTLKSDVPTSPLEDGSDGADHIILRPIPIEIQGNVADIYVKLNPVVEAFSRIQSEIGNVTKYLPPRTQTQLSKVNGFAQDAFDVTRRVDSIVEDGEQALKFFGNKSENTSIRKKFVDEMTQLHYSRQLVSIQMPFFLLEDMRITSLVIEEDNESEDLKFTLSAVEVPKVKTTFTDINQFFKNPSTGTNGQLEGISDKAAQAGEQASQSILDATLSLFR